MLCHIVVPMALIQIREAADVDCRLRSCNWFFFWLLLLVEKKITETEPPQDPVSISETHLKHGSPKTWSSLATPVEDGRCSQNTPWAPQRLVGQ